MLKNTMKYVTLALLLVCIITVPFLGVKFGGYASPSIFDDDAVYTTMNFGGGTSVFLGFKSDSEVEANQENLQKTADILKNRFQAVGYTDSNTEVVGKTIRLDLAQTNYIDAVIAETAAVGKWSVSDSGMSKTLCDASMIEDVSIEMNANGSYSLVFEFTEEGATKFNANAALTSSYTYLLIDGQYAAMSYPASQISDTYSFGNMSASQASQFYSFIKYGELPSAVVIESTEALEPALGAGIRYTIFGLVALMVLVAAAALILKGKTVGVFAAMAMVANACVMITFLTNKSFMFNVVSLITMIVCFLLSAWFSLLAVMPLGQKLAEGKSIVSAVKGTFLKFSTRGIWIRAIIFIVSLILQLFASGNFLYIFRIILFYSVTDFATYFIFTFIGAYTVAEQKE